MKSTKVLKNDSDTVGRKVSDTEDMCVKEAFSFWFLNNEYSFHLKEVRKICCIRFKTSVDLLRILYILRQTEEELLKQSMWKTIV
ncbi:UNVERIFIED_CONTAM: hypothetical protein NCL1_40132 [Trichonephila clavipes]